MFSKTISTYNAIMSAILTGVVFHELTHAMFYQELDFIGFNLGGNVAGVCGVGQSNPEWLAVTTGTLATILVITLTIWRKK